MKTILFVLISLVLACQLITDFAKISKDPYHFWFRFADCVIDALCIIGFGWIAKGAF